MKKDLIIGAYTNYNWDIVKYWANSIVRSGFTGDKVVIVYNSDFATVQKLSDMGFKIIGFSQDQQNQQFVYPNKLVIVVQRFFHLWQFISQLSNIDEYRYVIATDMKDVVFQKNPSDWLSLNLDKDICASTESLTYLNEPWGADNISSAYPYIWETMKNSLIWNCGVQAGNIQVMKDLWLHIFMMSHASAIHNPDQAAYNILLNSIPWKNITKFTMSESSWAAQLGTTMDETKIDNFRPNLIEPEPKFDGNYVTTSTGEIFSVVHQWDRVSKIKNTFKLIYG